MRARVGLGIALLGASACGFQIAATPTIDAPVDVPPDMEILPDMPLVPRTRVGLIGFWTFDDPAGSTYLQDTSGNSQPVPIEVVDAGDATAPTLIAGNAIANTTARLLSASNNHLPTDLDTTNAVTLEVWVKPQSTVQGTALEGAFIVGLTGSVVLRDVALLQAGDRWRGLVRTTFANDGSPALNATSIASTTGMTHLVLVADTTRRTLYVNGVAEANGTPGNLTNWDLSYPLMMFDEYQHARQWHGTLSLVAIFNRGLSLADIQQNFTAGPNAP